MILPPVVPPTSEIPPVLVITAAQASYYQEACLAYAEGEPGLEARFPGLSRADACDWAIIGFTVQDWLTFKQTLITQRSFLERLLADRSFYEKQLENQYEAGKLTPVGNGS